MGRRKKPTLRGPGLEKIPDSHIRILRKFGPGRVAKAKERLCAPCVHGLTVGVCYYKLLPITEEGQDCPYFTTERTPEVFK